jgi:large subunit ribosomal protein L3
MTGLIGKKMGMTQIFDEKGDEIPVTVLEMGPCPVAQIKSVAKDGYSAVQLAYEPLNKKDERKVAKPQRGHFAKASVAPHRYLREFRVDGDVTLNVGETVGVDIFTDVHYVSITGVSKGRGFTGVMKRHGFKGSQTMSHGTHEFFRHGGSIGMCEEPARVMKGHKMAGHHGDQTVTSLNLEVVRVFADQNLLLVKGAVPGPTGSLVTVVQSTRREKRAHIASEPKFVNPLKAAKRGGR